MALFIWLIIRLIQPEQYFSLTKNQPTVFFSRLIIPAEQLQYQRSFSFLMGVHMRPVTVSTQTMQMFFF
jgi:hypothetical protein